MSWDVYIMRVPQDVEEVEDIPGGWEPPSLGMVGEVREVLVEQLPGIVFDNDGRGEYDGPGFRIGIPLPGNDSEEVEMVALFVHGGGDAAGAALAVTEALGARAIETGNGGWLTAETAAEAFNAWQTYRDRVVRGDEVTDTTEST
ncbi:hypothetical protein [Glycomyces buryatensis]|uniref:Uncharacterized protein n=1 Tax=Glycomyces buryatensis TaxID=2570927 RepID=A0A4S8QEH7_9ACTN|nr:hypothetical protein [Glycomyces buryatensis]THV42808.1 hypothetical protein FAB82_04645 [Glycomyces buryatensis]